MRVRRFVPSLLLATTGLTLTACSHAGSNLPTPITRTTTSSSTIQPTISGNHPSVPPTPTVVIGPDSQNRVAVTQNDNAATIEARIGTSIRVTLDGNSPPFQWSSPMATDTSVLRITSVALSKQGDADAVFIAVRQGQAVISAQDDPHCTPSCGAASVLWRVVVDVTGSV